MILLLPRLLGAFRSGVGGQRSCDPDIVDCPSAGEVTRMDEAWKVPEPAEQVRAQSVWDAMDDGDPMPALEALTEDVVIDNGPGAGPWSHVEGKQEFINMYGAFLPVFGESFHQRGQCVFANSQFAVTLVSETGRHVESDEVFDNRAIYITRFDSDGKTERLWTVDLDSEAMEQFWGSNPTKTATTAD
jgi:hypothetical protein